MRTTVTLDPDTEQIVRRRMRERGATFKQALNELLRSTREQAATAAPFRTATALMGESRVDLDRALQVAAALEDDELVRRTQSAS